MQETYDLWEGKIPYFTEGEIPKLTYYPTTAKHGGGTVILCAGGGYRRRMPHEGRDFAEFFNAAGLDAFVLDYRVAPNEYPAALADARRAIRFVRHNAKKFGIDPDKIAIMGSSAGGHLAAHAATFTGELDEEVGDEIDKESYVPNAQILCYPALDVGGNLGLFHRLLGDRFEELLDIATPTNLVSQSTPPAFIWHTATDSVVHVSTTYRYAAKLREFLVPSEIHIFPIGKHGVGLATEPNRQEPYVRIWANLLERWLKLYEFIN
jgi:acetyl esterase/lipase